MSDAELAQQLRDATAQLDLLFGEVAQHNEGHSPLAMRRQLPRPATFSTLLHPSEAGPPQGPQDELAGEAEARVLDRDYSMLGLNLEVLQTRARASPTPHPPPSLPPAACHRRCRCCCRCCLSPAACHQPPAVTRGSGLLASVAPPCRPTAPLAHGTCARRGAGGRRRGAHLQAVWGKHAHRLTHRPARQRGGGRRPGEPNRASHGSRDCQEERATAAQEEDRAAQAPCAAQRPRRRRWR